MLTNDKAAAFGTPQRANPDNEIVAALLDKFGDDALMVAERQATLAEPQSPSLATWRRIVEALRGVTARLG